MKLRWIVLALLLLAALPVEHGHPVAQDAKSPELIELVDCLVLPAVGRSSRSPVHTDALEAQLVAGTFEAPKAGDKMPGIDGAEVEWRVAKAGEGGWLSGDDLAGGYAYWCVESATERVALLNARGHTLVYNNGTIHYGDPYDYGYVELPVLLKEGSNEFVFSMGRGRVKAGLQVRRPDAPSLQIGDDWTLPDIVRGSTGFIPTGSVNVLNFSSKPAEVTCVVSRGLHGVTGRYQVPALGVRRVSFGMGQMSTIREKPPEMFECKLAVHTFSNGERSAVAEDTRDFTIKVALVDDRRNLAFASSIDGSIQYYSVLPAKPLPGATDKPGIVLSLHGASVEASGQAGAYSPKSWCHIVCPTNRRPYGFDWEDWGRLDAMEVLAHAQATLDNDPTKVWLTGHSMGGHGTWTIGSHFPDKFAAIGPSAGWESFWSYAGGGAHPEEFAVSELLTRSANPSRTLLRKYNSKSQGVYILHGDADDNVPVTEARAMRDTLKEFHTDLGYFEQPSAGHWWDAGHDDGADCVDWAPMFDMFARRRLPRINEVLSVDFTTVCPEHSADCHWARVEMQAKQLDPSRVQISLAPNSGVFEGSTENVIRLSLQVDGVLAKRESLTVKLDGSEISVAWPDSGRVYLRKTGKGWQAAEVPAASLKGPQRYGWFKNAFNHRFVYVYGTQGSEADDTANFEKARFDLEQWGYRANGSFDVIADADFDAKAYAGRNAVLIGNADTNSAWAKLLKDCPVHVGNGVVRIGGREVKGDDLALLFTYPIAGSDINSVAVIAGTGGKGTRLTNRLGYFTSGASFPDLILYGPDMLETGTGGVIAAGYFGEDWSVSAGEFKWRDAEAKNK